MRAAPPVAFEARSFGAWRAGIAILALAAAASVVDWAVRGGPPAATAVSLLAVALCAAWLGRLPRFRLEWDGSDWRLTWRPGEAVQAGRVEVCIDLGVWMLLRWRAHGRGVRSRWLPVDAYDSMRLWRALRAAVYSAALAPVTDAVDRAHDV